MALAKQTGQVRLQRLVRSTLASPVWLVCRLHRPQSSGQRVALVTIGVLEAAVVAEGPLLHLQVEPGVGVDDVAKVAVLGAVLLHDDFAAVFEDPGINQFRAIRAQRLGLSWAGLSGEAEWASPYR